jgi:hypothetical protein
VQIRYLEVVTKEVDAVCAAYAAANGVHFGETEAQVAHPPMEIPGHGTFAIYIQGGVHHGLWQL